MFQVIQETDRSHGHIIQPQLEIGKEDDEHEKEADHIADKVMKMSDGGAKEKMSDTDGTIRKMCDTGTSDVKMSDSGMGILKMKDAPALTGNRSANKPAAVQAKCEKCEEEEKLQKKSDTPGIQAKCKDCEEKEKVQKKSESPADKTVASPKIVQQLKDSKGSGHVLPDTIQRDMGPKIGADLDSVKVHTDERAADMSKELGAKAFTNGNDIYFNQGQYNPSSHSGKHLLAHELTHTVQQNPSSSIKRKVSDDYLIKGKYENAAYHQGSVYFDLASSSIDSEEQLKINKLGLSKSKSITLKGYASEEGKPDVNLSIINKRLQNVKSALELAGYKGVITIEALPEASVGNLNYRKMRSVEMVEEGAVSSVQDCSKTPQTEVPSTAQENSFQAAQKEGVRIIQKGITELENKVISPETDALVKAIFSTADKADILDRLKKLLNHVANVISQPGKHQSGTDCNSTCSAATAYNVGTGDASMMTMCPSFYKKTPFDQAIVLIHESAHGAEDFGADDKAYAEQRTFKFLPPADALNNADSFSTFLSLVDDPGSASIGPKDPDVITGMTAPEKLSTEKMIANLELFISDIYMNFSSTYGQINMQLEKGFIEYAYYEGVIVGARYAGFDLTDPDLSSSMGVDTITTTVDDKVKVAGITDRLHKFDSIFWGNKVIIERSKTTTYWAADEGYKLYVGNDFFGLSEAEQQKLVWKQLVQASPDISSAMKNKYVELPYKVNAQL